MLTHTRQAQPSRAFYTTISPPVPPGCPRINRLPSINHRGRCVSGGSTAHRCRGKREHRGDARKLHKVEKAEKNSIQRVLGKQTSATESITLVVLKLLGKRVSETREMLWAVFSANVKTTGAQIGEGFRELGDQ